MKRICMDCKADLGSVEGPDDRTSHGLCPPCHGLRQYKLGILQASNIVKLVGIRKLAQASVDRAPAVYSAAIEAMIQEIAEALTVEGGQ